MDDVSENSDNAVTLTELFHLLRDQRSLIVKITGGFVVLGLIIALFSPVEYTSEALLMPEMKTGESSAGDLLQSYGGMLGLGGLAGVVFIAGLFRALRVGRPRVPTEDLKEIDHE